MPPLAAIERFFERLFERPSARLFRARLQPVQLQRRIERAMESERLASADRTLVPNRFVVHLNPADLDGFGDMTGVARHRARRRGAPVRPVAPLHAGRPARASTCSATRPWSAPTSGSSPGSPTRSPAGARPGDRRPGQRQRPMADADDRRARPTRWSSRCRAPSGAAGPPAGHRRRTAHAHASIVDGTDLTIGRAADNDLVLARRPGLAPPRSARPAVAARSSTRPRQHERLAGQRRRRSASSSSGQGDRLELGDSVIVVEVAGDGT